MTSAGAAAPTVNAEKFDRALTADDRDRTAEAHDASAAERDDRAARRDDRAAARDERLGRVDVEAAADRAGAKRDRRGAAGDRQHAADDREAAVVDRELSAEHERSLVIDELTGAFIRAAGTRELELQLAGAAASGTSFVLAFIDIDHLKAVNDMGGHDAGDRLLTHVAGSIRSAVRDADVIVRFGGDEFLCGQIGVELHEASVSYEDLNVDLAARAGASVSIGVVQAQAGEDLATLIERADVAMYESKRLTEPDSTPSDHPQF
ncbi:MAG: GGDEF domain-containing protein [bacterium]|nr:GGDEF domain-containing protein [bacterium]